MSYPPSQDRPPYNPQPQDAPQYGQPPQGMPPYGQQPNYGQPQPQGQPGYGYAPPAQPRWNGLAIAGFVLSFLFSLLGLILSIIALNQINKSGGMQKGKGLALAGIIISLISIIGTLLLFTAGSRNSATTFLF